ncbi:lysophospholipid acyltransferase family protein [Wenxinia saemankumensis]|uniref:KDO2-lipid IV(A) lauroyltransferase n=1 Tax=Wenxinia saemankumensis TaxID=1447782 RepID=A0A1M6EXL4_9RHOB|nr:lysophospholipid acyltransferase family protein [Wenxinia saemankumensis]SHI90150.1 KDO2-lipid IV(A) lauroyltransferase [Wenxinia saemankumensis]
MSDIADRTANAAFLALIRAVAPLPYRRRIPLVGRIVAQAAGPLAGFRARAEAHLAAAMPGLPPSERRRIAVACLDNFGRAVAELYSGPEFRARVAASDALTGPGLPQLLAERAGRRPVLIAVGHFGNYDALRAALIARGETVGALYRPMDNPYFEGHYRRAMEEMARPLFPRDRSGVAGMVRHLRGGGLLAIAMDQHVSDGAVLSFFGRPARTTLSPAELAARYGARLYTAHAIRREGGLDFDVVIDPPVPEGPAEAMMQQVNDRIEAVVRAHPGQYFWVHRRWKVRELPAAGAPA